MVVTGSLILAGKGHVRYVLGWLSFRNSPPLPPLPIGIYDAAGNEYT